MAEDYQKQPESNKPKNRFLRRSESFSRVKMLSRLAPVPEYSYRSGYEKQRCGA